MRTIIAGSRSITNISQVITAIKAADWTPSVIISGGAHGVDRLGEIYAKNHNIPCEIFKAQWDTYGKSAGYIRNQEMASKAEALIAIWDGISRGTEHMVKIARKAGLKVYVHELNKQFVLK